VKKKMIYGLPIPLAHVAPTKQITPLSNEPFFSKCSSKEMEDQSGWGKGAKGMIKGSNLKYLPFRRNPIDLILETSSQPERVQKNKERSDQLHLNHALVW
jgi:hypothetical protein